MAEPDRDHQLWEIQSKGLNFLLVAHAAGLIACLTVLKDYNTTPQLKGIGAFVWLFGIGLISTIVAISNLSSYRMGEPAAWPSVLRLAGWRVEVLGPRSTHVYVDMIFPGESAG